MSERLLAHDAVFSCLRCGDCCRGRGGIVLRESDSERLAAFFGLAPAAFRGRYAEKAHGKYRLRGGENGFCVFSGSGGLCAVHAARPDICRAWPFFRGNLVDPVSLAMAEKGCPGIAKGVAFGEFAGAGARYLLDNGIFSRPGEEGAPSALVREEVLRQLAAARNAAEREAQ